MKKKILISVFVLIFLILCFIPFKLANGFFSSKMVENLPSKYENKIPNRYVKDHVYSIISEKKSPISFFRTKDADFVTTQINLNKKNSLAIYSQEPLSLTNESYEVFNFTNSKVLNIYGVDNVAEINKISFKGKNVKVISNNNDYYILKFPSDFEISLDNERFFYVETTKDIYVILKNIGTIAQLYILEIYNTSNVNIVLKAFD